MPSEETPAKSGCAGVPMGETFLDRVTRTTTEQGTPNYRLAHRGAELVLQREWLVTSDDARQASRFEWRDGLTIDDDAPAAACAGVAAIASERKRVVDVGSVADLIAAAYEYLAPAECLPSVADLVRAGALIAAAIDKAERQAAVASTPGSSEGRATK